MEAATSEFAKLPGESAWQLSDDEVVALVKGQHRVEAQQSAAGLQLLRDVESRAVPATVGAPNLRAWLMRTLQLSPQVAGERIRMMQRLRDQCRGTPTAPSTARKPRVNDAAPTSATTTTAPRP